MRITSLSLRSFRSYDELSLEFSAADPDIFIGQNGSGKTNLIEAVALLSQGRSCLRADPTEMLKDGADFFRVRGETRSDAGEIRALEYVFQTSPRRASAYFIQDVRTPLLSFIGALPSITFLPQDLDLFTGSPLGRRNFVDVLLSQLKPEYAKLRLEYDRILKQRNALLKRIAAGESSPSDLDLWDEQLAQSGSSIRVRRCELLERIARQLPKEVSLLGEEVSPLQMLHAPAGDLRSDLAAARQRDILLQTTTHGPHRDDWSVLVDTHPIGHFLSRGQQRTVFLGLLFVSAGLFVQVRKERPVILLDDVLSELDDHHQRSLLSRLSEYQVLLTTTHPIPHMAGLRTHVVGEAGIVAA